MNTYPIIPKPQHLQAQDGFFRLTSETKIVADSPNQGNAAYLRDFLAPALGVSLSVTGDSDQNRNAISLKLDPALQHLGTEGYSLTIEIDRVQISAFDPAGVFYGLQTLRQLLPPEIENRHPVSGVTWQIPCCQITDQPRFPWRGYMLDEGRHFQSKETVLAILDLMALQKLNIFHWHLTEDQGWRIEINAYPKLTAIGAHRAGTAQSFGDLRKKSHDGIPHAGFYTQAEIREIVVYAAQRHITIIPEIEIPGHCRAAIAAYPELGCTSAVVPVATGPGIYKDIYCAGKESTFEFLQIVFDEILALFPAKIIHIGGDEAPKARWKECPACQQRIQAEGLKNEHELQTYFINRIAEYVNTRGREVMGWNEILDAFHATTKTQRREDTQSSSSSSFESSRLRSENAKNPIIQYWVRNKKDLLAALKNGQKVVNSAYLDTYLDHSYSLTPLRRAYQFEPVFAELDAHAASNILGFEAPLWAEWVPNRARLDYQTFPRLTAFAEVGWTPVAQRNYPDFRARLAAFTQRLDVLGVRYAPESDWNPALLRRAFGIFSIAQPQKRVAGNHT